MILRNFLDAELTELPHCHDGDGTLLHADLFEPAQLASALRFVHYTVLPSGTSIGLHTHGEDNEIYIILSGNGIAEVDGERQEVSAGDVLVNPPHGTHGLFNTSLFDMRILVIEAGMER